MRKSRNTADHPNDAVRHRGPRAERPAPRRRSAANKIYPAAGLTVFIIVWEVLVRLKDVPEYRLPAPSAIATEFVDKFPLLMQHAGVTVMESVVGFVVGGTARGGSGCGDEHGAARQADAVSVSHHIADGAAGRGGAAARHLVRVRFFAQDPSCR